MLSLTSTICGTFTATNSDLVSSVNVTVQKMQDDKTLSTEQTLTIPASSSETITLTDGIYIINDVTNSLSFKVPVYCVITSCLTDKIKNIVCDDNPCGCEDSVNLSTQYEFVKIGYLVFGFFSLLNNVYVTGFQFSTLSDSELDNLFVLSQLLSKITTYCNC